MAMVMAIDGEKRQALQLLTYWPCQFNTTAVNSAGYVSYTGHMPLV